MCKPALRIKTASRFQLYKMARLFVGSGKKGGITENRYIGLDITVYRYLWLPLATSGDQYVQTVIPSYNYEYIGLAISVTRPGSDIAIKRIYPDRYPHL
jgi:hypothetical protein